MVAAAVVAAGVASSAAGAISSSNAAGAQANSENKAINAQASMFDTTQANLSPFIQSGTQSTQELNNLTGLGGPNSLSSPLLQAPQSPTAMTESQVQQTPGYQFNLSQGLESVQNSAAARGLGVSGAALKGAATYATGLADSTYQNQFNNQQTLYQNQVANQSNQFNRLLGLSSLGENAGAALGGISQNTANAIGNAAVGSGTAQGAGDIGVGNGITGAVSSVPQGLLLNNFLTSPSAGASGGGFNPISGQALTSASGF